MIGPVVENVPVCRLSSYYMALQETMAAGQAGDREIQVTSTISGDRINVRVSGGDRKDRCYTVSVERLAQIVLDIDREVLAAPRTVWDLDMGDMVEYTAPDGGTSIGRVAGVRTGRVDGDPEDVTFPQVKIEIPDGMTETFTIEVPLETLAILEGETVDG